MSKEHEQAVQQKQWLAIDDYLVSLLGGSIAAAIALYMPIYTKRTAREFCYNNFSDSWLGFTGNYGAEFTCEHIDGQTYQASNQFLNIATAFTAGSAATLSTWKATKSICGLTTSTLSSLGRYTLFSPAKDKEASHEVYNHEDNGAVKKM